jgi:hypothetical protein
MKRLVSLIFVFVLLLGGGVFYYTNVDKNYHTLQEFYDFPVPNDATLESESENAKNYKWEPSTGTEVPLSYRLMIKKNGWKQIENDGHNVIYKKDNNFINLGLAPYYIDILKESK